MIMPFSSFVMRHKRNLILVLIMIVLIALVIWFSDHLIKQMNEEALYGKFIIHN